jgi:carboxyl-terminal processing protease
VRLLLLFLFFQLPVKAREYSPALARETFLHVWNRVNVSFYEETFNGIDWKVIKSKYEGRVEKSKSGKELRVILNEMLGELKLSHFGISKNHDDPGEAAATGGHLGLDLRMVGQQVMIFEIEKNSPADRAGLKPGMLITSFEGDSMAGIIEDFELTPKSSRLRRMIATRSILEKLSNPPDGKTTLKTTGSNKVFDFEPGFYRGERGRMGNETNLPVSFETRLVGDDKKVRLIAFDLFLPQLMLRINNAIAQARTEQAAGLIIDLRGNPGGLGVMATGLIGRIIDQELDLGDMNNTSGNLPFHAFPQKGAYLGPVAILVDSFSASTSEILAAALQEHKRARIIGRPTAAAVLPSLFEELPNGDRFQYAIGDFVTALNKVHLEGKGVTPDELITLDPDLLLTGTDPDLNAALSWLRQQSTQ